MIIDILAIIGGSVVACFIVLLIVWFIMENGGV